MIFIDRDMITKRRGRFEENARLRMRVFGLGLLVMAGVLKAEVSSSDQAPRLRVFASVLPMQYLVQRVGGSDVQTQAMVLPGQSPATDEPRPRQIAALATADLDVRVGVPFEDAWMRRILAANPGLDVLYLHDGLPRRSPTSRRAHPKPAVIDDHAPAF